jgi:NADH-quinone oxidoreductase subunit F
MKVNSIEALEGLRKKLASQKRYKGRKLLVCCGPGCLARGSGKVAASLKKELAKEKGDAAISVIETGCHGLCECGPLATLDPEKTFYTRVTPGDAEEIVQKTVRGGEILERLLYKEPGNGTRFETYEQIPFYARQTRIALRFTGKIDPKSIEDYIAVGGYRALPKVLASMTPEQVIGEVEKSGLRGKGGGGFATGRKWRSCVEAGGDARYLICNGDEGDPGAFMDRAIMEGDPFSVIEGMTIGAFAIGTDKGYIYVRREYPLAVEHLDGAIRTAREYGLLGKNILGTGFDFDIRINRGGGAFVCGESSALMRSIEGKVGEPRPKYIRSVVKGLYDSPTVLNNVETWTTVPPIIEKGAEWFASMGTKKSKGTKAFCLVGKVNNTGLIEVPMGTKLSEIIQVLGSGVKHDRTFKAVQTGGPSGGCLPGSLLHLGVDFDSLTEAGSMMGSGGMIVMDDRTCMVDVAKYFVHFLIEESCGKCIPCREGLRQLHEMLLAIAEGRGAPGDIERIEALSDVITSASLCGLGQSAPNPVLSTIRYFREEYRQHIEEKKCPAGVCQALITYSITDKCNGCMACAKVCPVNAITGEKKAKHVLDENICTRCGACIAVCPVDAIEVH